MTTTNTTITVLGSKDQVARAGAEEFARAAREAVNRNGAFSVALAGGSTPLGMYRLLAGEPFKSRVEWERALFFWSDERCVPPDHPDSNYGATMQAFGPDLGVPESNIHRMKGELEPHTAAREYDLLVREHISGSPPRFDVIFLGMGDDGHTASLFPYSAALDEEERLVAANHVPKLDAWRLTFTSPLINAAHRVVFLVTGEGKAQALKAVLEGEPDTDKYPSQLVRPLNGHLLYLVDEPAASLLTRR